MDGVVLNILKGIVWLTGKQKRDNDKFSAHLAGMAASRAGDGG